MVKILILIATICFFGATYGNEDLVKEFWRVRENAVYQYRKAKVEIETTIYSKVKAEMDKAKDDDQKGCMDNAKSLAIGESATILNETVGKILPDVKEVYESLETGGTKKLEEFNKKYNYPEYKKTEWANFKEKLTAIVPKLLENLGKCVA
uniref:Heteropteran venom family 1 protein 2 n=1 Tax=Ectomocoris sp. TaxID=3104572 RepID=A0AB38ZE53_9HEMI